MDGLAFSLLRAPKANSAAGSIGAAINFQSLSCHSVRKSLGRLQQTEVRIQLTNLVGCFNVSSRKIYPLLLVSDATEIEVATNTSPVHPRACGEHMKSSV